MDNEFDSVVFTAEMKEIVQRVADQVAEMVNGPVKEITRAMVDQAKILSDFTVPINTAMFPALEGLKEISARMNEFVAAQMRQRLLSDDFISSLNSLMDQVLATPQAFEDEPAPKEVVEKWNEIVVTLPEEYRSSLQIPENKRLTLEQVREWILAILTIINFLFGSVSDWVTPVGSDSGALESAPLEYRVDQPYEYPEPVVPKKSAEANEKVQDEGVGSQVP